MVGNASYLLCIFMIFNENMKMTEKGFKNTNEIILGPNYKYVIEPVISYDKCIDVMGLNKI